MERTMMGIRYGTPFVSASMSSPKVLYSQRIAEKFLGHSCRIRGRLWWLIVSSDSTVLYIMTHNPLHCAYPQCVMPITYVRTFFKPSEDFWFANVFRVLRVVFVVSGILLPVKEGVKKHLLCFGDAVEECFCFFRFCLCPGECCP